MQVRAGDVLVVKHSWPQEIAHIVRWDPARVLAECEAKRRLIAEVFQYEAKIDGEWGCCHNPDEIQAGRCPEILVNEIEALQILALPYAAHPDYLPEW